MKEHPRHNKYFVEESGRVFSARSGELKELTQSNNGTGYFRVRISKGGIKKHLYVHRMVAETYLDNPHSYTEVNHINGDKADNSVSNLEWCNRKQNMQHAVYTGLHKPKNAPRRLRREYIVRVQETGEEFLCKDLKGLADTWGVNYKSLLATLKYVKTSLPLKILSQKILTDT